MSAMRRLRRRLGHVRDEGMAMITAILVVAVAASLAVIVITESQHTVQTTAHDRSWTQALHVAEAGVQNAMASLQATAGAVPAGAVDGAVPEGTYRYTVEKLARDHYRIVSTGTVGRVTGLAAKRRLEVTLAPPLSFRYALFSLGDVTTKNNNYIKGDVWANGSVTVYSGDTIEGSATAATGTGYLQSGSKITANLQTGGTDGANALTMENDAVIGGDMKASTTDPCSPGPNSQYSFSMHSGSSIGGNATTWAPSVSGTVNGSKILSTCTSAPPTKTMPPFTFNPANYDPSLLHMFGTPSSPSATAVSDFQSYVATHSSAFSGIFYVYQSGAVGQTNRVDLTGVVISGDTVVITNAPIYSAASTNVNDVVVILYSSYAPPVGSSCDVNKDDSECAIHAKNNFQFDTTNDRDKAAVLLYAPNGPVAVKNNAEFYGAVYASNIEIKNNMDIFYDARVDQVIGFGETTLAVDKWAEVPAS